jgi:hypothetical protein
MAPTDPPKEVEASGIDASADLRRSVTQATERIHEIIDAAERVGLEIRREAEADAEAYMAQKKREADQLAEAAARAAERAAGDRTRALDLLIGSLADSAERFRDQTEEVLEGLDRAIATARAEVDASLAMSRVRDQPATPLADAGEPRVPQPPGARRSPLGEYSGRASEEIAPADPEPAERQPLAGVGNGDQASHALIRATHLAVTGKDRDQIDEILRAEFPGLDPGSLLDAILS